MASSIAPVDICKTILAAVTSALESEELRLKPRSERPEGLLWPWTVRVYYENWIRYLLVRELTVRHPELELGIEAESGGVSQVDLLIRGYATVELKGPDLFKKNFPKGIYSEILEDFNKQRRRATKETKEPKLKQFVLLIVHALKSEFYDGSVQRWLDQLESDVQEKNPGICIRLQPSKPLVLNGDEPWLMEFCLYSVR